MRFAVLRRHERNEEDEDDNLLHVVTITTKPGAASNGSINDLGNFRERRHFLQFSLPNWNLSKLG